MSFFLEMHFADSVPRRFWSLTKIDRGRCGPRGEEFAIAGASQWVKRWCSEVVRLLQIYDLRRRIEVVFCMQVYCSFVGLRLT